MSTLRELLNRARWGAGNLHDLLLVVVHRGAPEDRRSIAGARIVAVLPAGVEVTSDEDCGEGVYVPYHRFLAIHGADGAPIWSKGQGDVASEAAVPANAPAGAPVLRVVERAVEVTSDFSVVLRPRHAEGGLVLDGSVGEGGGQILRAALTLSLLSGLPFCVEHIRGKRAKPGLLRQHLTAVKAAAAISGAEVEGATLGSERLVFRPGSVRGGEHAFDIGSAGSAALVVQTIALPLALCAEGSQVRIRGGTHAQWAPIYPFLEQAWLPLVQRAGAEVALELRARGFYPAGGGELLLHTAPSPALRPLHMPDASVALALELEAEVANLPEGIARRELAAVADRLTGTPLRLTSRVVRSAGPGNALWLTARPLDAACATNVFSAIGEVGRSAEDVAAQVADAFLRWREARTSVEEHLADQIMLPIAIAGAGSFTCNALSLHARTHLEVIDAFLGRRFEVWDLGDGRYRLTL